MKTYKTWEAIKMLTENPTLKFINKCDNIIGVNRVGFIVLFRNDNSVNTDLFRKNVDTDWALVQEPVTFMEAINSGKRIKSAYSDDYNSVEETMSLLGGLTEKTVLKVLNGEWFIESEN